jgi:hypothetical protein
MPPRGRHRLPESATTARRGDNRTSRRRLIDTVDVHAGARSSKSGRLMKDCAERTRRQKLAWHVQSMRCERTAHVVTPRTLTPIVVLSVLAMVVKNGKDISEKKVALTAT